jgi:hypothetical protein
MAEPTIRADQHAHVEAENRLHNELVILYRDVYMWQRLKQSLKLHDWPRVEIYQPYISLLNVLARWLYVPGSALVTQELGRWHAALVSGRSSAVHSQMSGR